MALPSMDIAACAMSRPWVRAASTPYWWGPAARPMLASMKTPEISEWMTSVARAGSTTLGPTDATSPRSQPDRPALPTATSFDL